MALKCRSEEDECLCIRLTNFSESLVDFQLFEQLHAPAVGDVHFGPSCGIKVALDEHAFDTIGSEL